MRLEEQGSEEGEGYREWGATELSYKQQDSTPLQSNVLQRTAWGMEGRRLYTTRKYRYRESMVRQAIRQRSEWASSANRGGQAYHLENMVETGYAGFEGTLTSGGARWGSALHSKNTVNS